MTKKYEKFEEWMIGKKVEYSYRYSADGTNTGVISPRRGLMNTDEVWIEWDSGHSSWVNLSRVKFLEEEDEEVITSPIPWEVGQVVWDVMFGHGVVTSLDKYEQYGVDVDFSKWGVKTFTVGGAFNDGANRTLFFSEPTIIADTMPPKKPFVPKLKEGDKVVVISKTDSDTSSVGEIMSENEFQVTFTDGRLFKKEYWNIFKLGEEIKFEEN